jgi:hypothetical protein
LVGPKNGQKPQKKFILGVAKSVLWRIGILLKANGVKLFVSSFFLFSGTIHRTFGTNTGVFTGFCDRLLKRPFLTFPEDLMDVANIVLWRIRIILKANIVNLLVFYFFFFPWYHSPNFLDTPCTLPALLTKMLCDILLCNWYLFLLWPNSLVTPSVMLYEKLFFWIDSLVVRLTQKRRPHWCLLLGKAIYRSIYKHFAPHSSKNGVLSLRTCSMSDVIWLYL